MDDETTITTEPAAPEASPAAPKRGDVKRSVTSLVLAILLALTLAESVLLFRGNNGDRSRTEVLSASTNFLTALTTYNSSSIERQRRQVLSLAAGKFRQQYEQVTSAAFLKTLSDTKADQRGQVIRAAVSSVQDDSASVLALIRTTTTNKDLKAPRIEQSVIELSLVHTKGGWKIDNVTIVGTLAA